MADGEGRRKSAVDVIQEVIKKVGTESQVGPIVGVNQSGVMGYACGEKGEVRRGREK